MKRVSKAVMVRDIQIGGGAPVAVQSMTKTDTTDVDGTLRQIDEMVEAGCEIVRIAVPDDDAAAAMYEIRKRTSVPIVADIHFHYKLALKALDAGIDKLRINPGNIGSIDRVREVVRAAEARKVPIRIGVNGGSLEKDLLKKYGTATPEAMVESGMRHIRILEDLGFGDIVISLKASDVNRMVAAYRLMAANVDYPLHLGVTLRIYSRSLTAAEVQNDMSIPIGGAPTGGPPSLVNPGNRTDAEGAAVSLQLSASDPDGDQISYSASALPPGLTVNPSTGLISGALDFTS